MSGVFYSVFSVRQALWAHLLEDQAFRRWYENLARGSEWTARGRARDLNRFLEKVGMTPDGFTELARSDRGRVEDMLMDFVSDLHRAGYSPGYMENYVKAIKSWLEFNDVKLVRRIKIGDRNRTPTTEDERVPTKDELRQILNYANERSKCSIAMMAFSGLRPQVLGDIDGSDGFEVRDLPEIKIEGGGVSFVKIPTIVVVRPSLSKAGHKYFNFLSSEGCEYVSSYLEKRLATGEELNLSSAIIGVKPGYEEAGWRVDQRSSGHVTTKTLTKEIRDAIRPKYDWRPYVLRAYCDTQLMVAENHGKISHAYRQFFMGHKGDIEARYTTNKGRLPEEVIEDMRESYRKCQEYLQTSTQDPSSEDRIKESFKKQLLLIAGFKPEEINGMDLSMDDLTFQELVRKRLLGAMINQGASQRVIGAGDVEHYLSEGWGFVANLPGERVVVKIQDSAHLRHFGS